MVRNLKSSHSANLEEALALCKGWGSVHVGPVLKGYDEQGTQAVARGALEEKEISTEWASQRSRRRGSQSWASNVRQNLDS